MKRANWMLLLGGLLTALNGYGADFKFEDIVRSESTSVLLSQPAKEPVRSQTLFLSYEEAALASNAPAEPANAELTQDEDVNVLPVKAETVKTTSSKAKSVKANAAKTKGTDSESSKSEPAELQAPAQNVFTLPGLELLEVPAGVSKTDVSLSDDEEEEAETAKEDEEKAAPTPQESALQEMDDLDTELPELTDELEAEDGDLLPDADADSEEELKADAKEPDSLKSDAEKTKEAKAQATEAVQQANLPISQEVIDAIASQVTARILEQLHSQLNSESKDAQDAKAETAKETSEQPGTLSEKQADQATEIPGTLAANESDEEPLSPLPLLSEIDSEAKASAGNAAKQTADSQSEEPTFNAKLGENSQLVESLPNLNEAPKAAVAETPGFVKISGRKSRNANPAAAPAAAPTATQATTPAAAPATPSNAAPASNEAAGFVRIGSRKKSAESKATTPAVASTAPAAAPKAPIAASATPAVKAPAAAPANPATASATPAAPAKKAGNTKNANAGLTEAKTTPQIATSSSKVQQPAPKALQPEERDLPLTPCGAMILNTYSEIKSVEVENRTYCDTLEMSKTQLAFVGKACGSTNIRVTFQDPTIRPMLIHANVAGGDANALQLTEWSTAMEDAFRENTALPLSLSMFFFQNRIFIKGDVPEQKYADVVLQLVQKHFLELKKESPELHVPQTANGQDQDKLVLVNLLTVKAAPQATAAR